jgi:hypothetical protein
MERFKRTSDEAKARAKDFEEQARRHEQLFAKVRNEAIGLFGALAGASGIKEFVSNMVSGDAATARFARTMGVSASEVAKWQAVARRFGASSEEMAQGWATLQDQLQSFQRGMADPTFISVLGAIAQQGRVAIDANMPMPKLLEQIATGLENIKRAGPAGQAEFLARRLPIGAGFQSMLLQGWERVHSVLDEVNKQMPPTDEHFRRAEDYVSRWERLSNIISNIGRGLDPLIERLFGEAEGKEGATKEAGSIASSFKQLWHDPSWENLKSFLFGTPQQRREMIEQQPPAWLASLNESLRMTPDTVVAPSGRPWVYSGAGPTEKGFRDVPWHIEAAAAAMSARGVAGFGAQTSFNRSSASTEVNINGPITITPPQGASARDVAGALTSGVLLDYAKRNNLAAMSQTGAR